MKVSEMSDDELRTLASKRFKNGRITKHALEAQRELWERHGRPFSADRFRRTVVTLETEIILLI